MQTALGVHDLIAARNLEIHFMPIVRLSSRDGQSSWRNYAFEALVRGPEAHPLRQPAALFAAANAARVRQELEVLCVDTALEHQVNLPEGTRLFLNVGLGTFLSDALLDVLQAHHGGAPARRTVVEVLEDEIPESRSFRRRAEHLTGLGYEIALDDLTCDADTLCRLVESGPVRFWKLDRSVLSQWGQREGWVKDWLPTLARAAQRMGTEVVVEGLENGHLRHVPGLCELGITLGQGYAFGKPAILGPGLRQWRQGFHTLVTAGPAPEAAPLVPVRLDPRLRGLLAAMPRWGG